MSLALPLLCLLLAVTAIGLTGCKKKTAEDRFKEVEQLLGERQIPLAILRMKDLIAEFPDDPATLETRSLLAQVYLQLGREENVNNALDQLQAIYDKVGFADDRGAAAYFGIAQIYARQNNLPKALEHVEKGVELTVDYPNYHSQMEFLLCNMRLVSEDAAVKEQGIARLRDMMVTSEDPAMRGAARETLAAYYRDNKQYAESNAIYTLSMEKFPDDEVNPQLLMAQAVNFRLDGKESEGEAIFRDGAAKMSKQIDEELNLNVRGSKLQQLATYYEQFGDTAKAEEQLRRIMSEQPASRAAIQAQFDIGALFIRASEYDKAEALMEQIKSENPNTNISQTAENWLRGIAMEREQLAQQAQAAASDAGTSPSLEQTAPAEGAKP